MMKERISGERRKFTRFEVDIPAECKPVSSEKKRSGIGLVYATIKNISTNGILLHWPAEFQLPRFLRLAIKIATTSKPAEYIARIIWSKEKKFKIKAGRKASERYDVGLSFIQDERSRVPKLISQGTNFYWEIFERTGYISAYLLHKGIGEKDA